MVCAVLGTYERFLLGYDCDLRGKADLKKAFTYAAHQGPVKCVSAAGPYIASGGSDDLIHLYSTVTGADLGFLVNPGQGDVGCLSFFTPADADGPSHLLSGGGDGFVSIWMVGGEWEHLKRMRGHKGAVNGVSVHHTGRVALSSGRDIMLCMWDLMRGKRILKIRLASEASSVAFRPDGETYLLPCGPLLHLMATAEGQGELLKWEHPSAIRCVGQVDGNCAVTGCDDGIVRLWDARESTASNATIVGKHQTRVRGLDTFVDNGVLHVATGSSDGSLRIWDARKAGTDSGWCLCCEAGSGARLTCLCMASTAAKPPEGRPAKRQSAAEKVLERWAAERARSRGGDDPAAADETTGQDDKDEEAARLRRREEKRRKREERKTKRVQWNLGDDAAGGKLGGKNAEGNGLVREDGGRRAEAGEAGGGKGGLEVAEAPMAVSVDRGGEGTGGDLKSKEKNNKDREGRKLSRENGRKPLSKSGGGNLDGDGRSLEGGLHGGRRPGPGGRRNAKGAKAAGKNGGR
eukprot:evm.model.scf_2735.1 EVM.evm.TU.scf_2735.1   scf_2735:861-9416(-)